LQYLFNQRSAGGESRLEAYVIDCGDASSEVAVALRHNKPRVTAHLKLDEGADDARDLATGRPVELWSAKVESQTADRAEVYVTWFLAPLGAGGNLVKLHRVDGQWVVEDVRTSWIS